MRNSPASPKSWSTILVLNSLYMLSLSTLADLEARLAINLKPTASKVEYGRRMADLREQVANLTDALAASALRSSTALADRLVHAETELTRLATEAARPRTKVIEFPVKLTARVRKAVENMLAYLHQEPDRARAAVRELVGEIPCAPDETGKFLVARVGLSETLLRAVGGSEILLVAGAGFEPATFGL